MANTFTANQYPPSQSAVSLLERMRLAEERKRLLEQEERERAEIEKWGQHRLNPIIGPNETLPAGSPLNQNTSLRPIHKGGIRGAVYDFVEPAMTHNIESQHMGGLLDWRNIVGGLADTIGKSTSLHETPSKMDMGMAVADVVGLGLPKVIKSAVSATDNYIPGFYGGSPLGRYLGVATTAAKAPFQMARQALDPMAAGRADRGLPNATRDVIIQERRNLDDLSVKAKMKGMTEEISAGMREASRKIAGQIGQNIIHAVMQGRPLGVLKGWRDRHFGAITSFDRANAREMFDDVDADLLFDMSNEAWKPKGGVGLAPKSGGRGPVFVEKKYTSVQGDSRDDVIKSRQFIKLREINEKYQPKTKKGWVRALDEYDPDWSKNLGIGRIEQGSDGVIFQFSPAGKRDYLLGGFNALVKVRLDGRAKVFGTDKQDIFGVGIPGASDVIVGIGTKELSFVPKVTLRKSNRPPKEIKVSKPTEKRKSGTSKKKKKPGARPPVYLSRKDRELLDSIMGVSAAPTSSYYIGTGATILGGTGLLSLEGQE